MPQPLVSVHLLTYNQIDFIADTIESALNQTYDALQIVIGDDGSTDGTTEVAQAYAKQYPDKIVLAGGEHVGINKNANRTLDACTGKYVAMLNGDDLFEPEKIERQVAWMEADARRTLCGHDVAYFSEDPDKPYQNQTDVCPMRSGVGPEDFLLNGIPFATVSVMVRRDALPEFGLDPQLLVSLDFKLWIDCVIDGGHFGYVEGVLAKYRTHPNNSTSRWPEQIWIDTFATMGLLEARHPSLTKACQSARARRFYQRGVHQVMQKDAKAARLDLMNSLRYNPLLSWKVYAWLIANEVPPSVFNVLKKTKQRLTT